MANKSVSKLTKKIGHQEYVVEWNNDRILYIPTTKKEKVDIINRFNEEAKTINETKALYESIKRELNKLNNTITRKDKKIMKLESESLNVKTQKELDKVKSELKELKAKYDDLHTKYDEVIRENVEFRKIFDEIENICDSD